MKYSESRENLLNLHRDKVIEVPSQPTLNIVDSDIIGDLPASQNDEMLTPTKPLLFPAKSKIEEQKKEELDKFDNLLDIEMTQQSNKSLVIRLLESNSKNTKEDLKHDNVKDDNESIKQINNFQKAEEIQNI